MALCMCLVGVYLATKHAAYLVGLGVECSWTFRAADPSFQREMERLFMSLPVMFCAESFLHVTRSATSITCRTVGWMEQDHVFEMAEQERTVQKVHWNVFGTAFRPPSSADSFGTVRLLRRRRPRCWKDPNEPREPREYAEANEPEDGEVPKLLAEELQDRVASSSVKVKGLLRPESKGLDCRMAEAIAVTLAGSFSIERSASGRVSWKYIGRIIPYQVESFASAEEG